MNTHDQTPADDVQPADPGEQLSESLAGPDETYIVEESPKSNSQGTLLMTLLLVAAGAGAWWWFKSGPATASASQPPEVAQADATISQFLKHDSENMRSMRRMFDSTQQFVEQFKSYPSMKQVPLTELHTNPFRFAKASAGEESDQQVKQQREQQRQEALQAVQELSLQSILVSGSSSACMINNKMYQEGEQVDAFLVEKISSASVVVRKGPYRFELKMAR